MMNEGFSYRYFAVPCWAAFTSLLLAALLLASCGDDGKTSTPVPTPTPVAVTVESGGMALAAAPATPTTPAAAPAPVTTEAQKSASAPPVQQEVLAPGTQVVATGVLRLYADADPDAQRLAQYDAGAEFVVVEPGDDYDAYPVDKNGVRWYRARALDGLVGWVMADAVGPKP
jgi:hypothetical protein